MVIIKKIVIQQVKEAKVFINNKLYSSINDGMLIFLGIHSKDTLENIKYLINKLVKLRIFKDNTNRMNLSILDLNYSILLVSQFTLYANIKKGNRPSFIDAASPDKAKELYNLFIKELNQYNINLETGKFGEKMDVQLINNGPNTFILES